MAVIFPDIEIIVVSYLADALTGTPFASAHVATKRWEPTVDDADQPAFQVVVAGNYRAESNFVLKAANLVIDCYAADYGDANTLGLLVESVIRDVVGDPIKQATVLLGPVRRANQGVEELRSIEVELLVKGDN